MPRETFCYELRDCGVEAGNIYGTEYMSDEEAEMRNERLKTTHAREWGVQTKEWRKAEVMPKPHHEYQHPYGSMP